MMTEELSGSGRDLHAGGRALEDVEDVGRHLVFNVFLSHGDDGAGDIPFLGGTVADDDGFVKDIGGVFQRDVQAVADTGDPVEVLVSHEAELDDVFRAGHADGVVTVLVRHDALAGPGVVDGRSRERSGERFTGADRTRKGPGHDGLVLLVLGEAVRKGQRREQRHDQQHGQNPWFV